MARCLSGGNGEIGTSSIDTLMTTKQEKFKLIKEVLERAEYGDYEVGYFYCLCCQNREGRGHDKTCSMKEALEYIDEFIKESE